MVKIIKKEISNNVLAGLMLVVVVLSVVSTTLLWTMSDTDEIAETADVTEDSGSAQISLVIEEIPNTTENNSDEGGNE